MSKPAGRHKAQQLTVRQIESFMTKGKHQDGNGLILQVNNKDSKQWLLRCTIKGQVNSDGKPLRRTFGLGSYKQVSLSQAREKARRYVDCAREGKDPSQELRDTSTVPNFKTAANEYLTMRLAAPADKGGWRNEKHRNQWSSTLETYVYPEIGATRIDQVKTSDIQSLLLPIWYTKRETARRVRQRVNLVFRYAAGKGWLSGTNPMFDLEMDTGGAPPRENFKALKYAELPKFMHWLRDVETPVMSRLALEFTILTASRTGEVIGAIWSEIDLDAALWTIPKQRMKAGKEHRVPLCDRAVEILKYLEPITKPRGWVFESQRPGKPLSNMAMLTLLRRHKHDFTTHGFRSSFRDWCAEQTGFPPAAVERCLAHGIKDKSEAAYHRSEYLEKRREIMSAWETYAQSAADGVGSNVVTLTANK